MGFSWEEAIPIKSYAVHDDTMTRLAERAMFGEMGTVKQWPRQPTCGWELTRQHSRLLVGQVPPREEFRVPLSFWTFPMPFCQDFVSFFRSSMHPAEMIELQLEELNGRSESWQAGFSKSGSIGVWGKLRRYRIICCWPPWVSLTSRARGLRNVPVWPVREETVLSEGLLHPCYNHGPLILLFIPLSKFLPN